jgi:hypothetical protein
LDFHSCDFFHKSIQQHFISHFESMSSEKESNERKGGEYATTQACNATKEELLSSKKVELDVFDDCPACWRSHEVKCLVADHCLNQPIGQGN